MLCQEEENINSTQMSVLFFVLLLIVGVLSEECPPGSEEFCCFGEKCREDEDYYVLPTPGSVYDDCFA